LLSQAFNSTHGIHKGFDVLRSTDGVNWSSIAFVRGAGNSHSARSYSYPDNNPGAGPHYYKLKQIDTDEKYKYSITVSALIGSKGEYVLGQNFPNPFNILTTIYLNLPEDATVNFSIYDALGRVVMTELEGERKSAGVYVLHIDGSSLSSGAYFYRVATEHIAQTRRMLLLK